MCTEMAAVSRGTSHVTTKGQNIKVISNNICMDWHHPMYHWRPQIIKENLDSLITINTDCEERESLMIATTEVNFELETDTAVSRQLVFNVI